MPRPKVDERFRKRIAKACQYCRLTKQKCDGLIPCKNCQRRDRSDSCAYSPEQPNRRHRSRRKRMQIPTGLSQETIGSEVSDAVTNSSQKNEETRSSQSYQGNTFSNGQEVSVPGLSHVLYDNQGKVVYLGDCAALSFLQNIQQLIETQTGHPSLAADVCKLSVVEEPQPEQEESLATYNVGDPEELQRLVDVFFVSSCGIIDLFEKAQIDSLLHHWLNGLIPMKSGSVAVLHLIVACGAQTRGSNLLDSLRAKYFYHHGRQLALLELTNYPTVETVQAFFLISIFMLGCSRRNGASLNLGIAISAAKSLGYHQANANSVFDGIEYQQRVRIWRTLRYHDLFFSAMMGRSSSTSDTDFNIVEEQSLMSEYSGDGTGQSLSMIESTRAFLIMERTINKVYTKRMVSLGLLQSLAREVQEKSSMLPKSLRVTASPKAQETPSLSTQQFNLRNTHVSCSYYFAMMLLSRPFLITALRAKSLPHFTENPRSGSTNDGKGNDISSEINDGAVTCIDSAMYTIQLLYELLTADMLFSNMPFVVAWTFVAVLVLSSAHFGRLDLQRPIEQTLHQADNILSCFAVNSPQARRYHLILKKLSKAAEEHWNQTNQKKPQSRTPYMPRLFQISPGNSEFTSNSFITESQAKEAVGDGRFLGNEDPCRVSSSVQAASSSPYTTPLLGQAVGPREHEALNDCLRLGNSTLFSDYNENSPGFELRGHEMTTTSGLSGDEPFSGFGDGATIWDFSWAGSL